MGKSQNFSIYLLKVGYNPTNSLKDNHNMKLVTSASRLPEGAVMYLADNQPKSPWWKSYWDLNENLNQVLKGAIVFLPVENRWMVLTFGISYHKLKDNCYEYDFGLIATLNSLDPNEIRSADILKPENARRQRIQMPNASNLNYFEFQQDENIIRQLSGYVKSEYSNFFKNITGSASLKITTKVPSDEIVNLCKETLEIYLKDDYKESFPGINNVAPIKDPDLIEKLDLQLLRLFKEEGYELVLAIPEIINYEHDFEIKFSGGGGKENRYSDVYIGAYRSYLKANNVEIDSVSKLKNHEMHYIDQNGFTIKKYSLYKCLLLDCEIEGKYYHLCEGDWYSIETDFIEKLSNVLNGKIINSYSVLTECIVHSEKEYNKNIGKNNKSVLCLDKNEYDSKSKIEPCDLLTVIDNQLHLIHVKISTRSSYLSHLFNQGVNSIAMLKSDINTKENFKSLVKGDIAICDLIDRSKYKVVFGIITKKGEKFIDDPSTKLPIFSRISLMRAINDLNLMSVPCAIYFIPDKYDRR